MSRKYRVVVRTTVIAEIHVTPWGYTEESIRRKAAVMAQDTYRQLKRARRPFSGGEFEVLTVEPLVESKTQ